MPQGARIVQDGNKKYLFTPGKNGSLISMKKVSPKQMMFHKPQAKFSPSPFTNKNIAGSTAYLSSVRKKRAT